MLKTKQAKTFKTSHLIVIALFTVDILLYSLIVLILFLPIRYVVRRSDEAIAISKTPSLLHSVGLPKRLKISKLSIDAPIEQVGQTSSGDMEVPNQISSTGWYEHGARPGNEGSAVIDGHLDGPNSEPGVFLQLSRLQTGDVITITDTGGNTTSFQVRELRSYNAEEHPREVFISSGGSHLNLITCTGAWDRDKKQFSKRLVVFTDRI